MVSTLVLSHGNLAESLVATARTIAGPIEGVEALVLDWDAPPEKLSARLGETIARLDQGQGVLILTDMHGDTPTKLALQMRSAGRVEVVTGVNLPMVVRLSCMSAHHRDVESLAAWIREKGQGSICLGSALPAGRFEPCPPRAGEA
jgi:PTS system mannose-specific IIA component